MYITLKILGDKYSHTQFLINYIFIKLYFHYSVCLLVTNIFIHPLFSNIFKHYLVFLPNIRPGFATHKATGIIIF